MNKKLISLLIAVCLVIGMLPIVSIAENQESSTPTETTGAALEATYTLKIADHDGTGLTNYVLTNYDTPVYSVNTTLKGYYRTADYSDELTENKRDYITQRAGDADNWNAKLIWHTGDEGPTLYLDGFKLETYNEEYGAWLKRGTQVFYHCAFRTGDTAPLKIVLQGEDSYIRNYHGIHYQNKLTIESVGDTKLAMFTQNTGIVPSSFTSAVYDSTSTYDDVIGHTLTLNANLDICTNGSTTTKTDTLVTDGTYAVEDWFFGIVSTREADLIVNGGNITIRSAGPTGAANTKGPFGMKAKVSGNIIVNGGNLTVEAGYRGIQVWPGYNMIINGGTVAAGVSSDGFYALYKSTIQNSPAEYATPVLPEGGSYKLWQGNSSESATEVTALSGNKRYFKVETLSGAPDASTPTEQTSAPTEETSAPTEETSAPTEQTSAPTEQTSAPTEQTSAPTEQTSAPTEQTSAPTQTTVPATLATEYTLGLAKHNNSGSVLSLKLTSYDTPVYAKNTIVTGFFEREGTERYEYTAQAVGSEDDWNAKLIWHSGDEGPTLYLDGFKIDSYRDDKASWVYRGSSGAAVNLSYHCAVYAGETAPLKIVLTGEDSYIRNYMGIHYTNALTIESDGNTKLTMQTRGSGIVPRSTSTGVYSSAGADVTGYGLTLNANLDITVTGGQSWNNGIIATNGGNLTVNGGNINLNAYNDGPWAITVKNSGNITVNDGHLTAIGGYRGVRVPADEKVYVNGGSFTAYGQFSAIYASNSNSPGTDVAIVPTVAEGVDFELWSGSSKDGSDAALKDSATFTRNNYIKVVEAGVVPPTETTSPSQTTAPSASTSPSQTTAPTSGTVPSTTSTAKPSDYTLKLYGTSYTLTDYDTPIYLKNTTAPACYNTTKKIEVTEPDGTPATNPTTGKVVTQTVVETSVTKDYTTQTKDGADETNYNAKLVWHTGDNGPTLYLKNFILDDYDEELNKYRYASATKTSCVVSAVMHTDKDAPLKIVLESGENVMKAYSGIQYQNALTIESRGDASLYLWTQGYGIVPSGDGGQYVANKLLEGNNLTLNANLTVSQGGWANADHSGHIIRVIGADLTINGGKIVTEYRGAAKSCRGIAVEKSGNLYVNGGYVYSESYNSANQTEAAIEVAGNIYVAGGTVDVVSGSQSGLRAANIYITGGTVKARVNYSALLVSAETGVISFTGGTVDLLGARPFGYNSESKTQAAKEPVVATGLNGWVGLNPYVVEAYVDEFNKYVKLGYGEVEKNEMPKPTPGGEIPMKTTVSFAGKTYELKKYDDDVIYTVNLATETTDKDGNPMTRYTQTTTGANADNWNAMFVWKSTDETPTLYLRGFKMDDWNNETKKFAANPNNKNGYFQTYAIVTGSAVPLTIVLTGEDSLIETQFGIHYNNDLTIKSEGNAKLTIYNQSSTVSSINAEGYTLTVDANLHLTIRSLYSSPYSGGSLMNRGDIIINGGTIVCANEVDNRKDVNGIVARGEGNVIINGGNITANGANGAGHANGAIQANGKLIINGGTTKLTSKAAVGMWAKLGIEVNGGVLNITVPWYAVTAGPKVDGKVQTAPVVFNGGTTTILAERAFYTGNQLTLGEGVKAYAGAGPKNAEAYDGSETKLALKPWFFVTNDPDKFIELDEEEEDDSDLPIFTLPTKAPTQAPTDATQAPADATVAPTDATVAPEATEAPEVTEATAAPVVESNTKIELTEGLTAEIPQELIDLGYDSAEKILQVMLESAWTIDENINRVSFFDADLMYKEGEEWIKADETHFPADGWLQVLLPYPEGTDMNTQFTALHMFSSAAFDKTPGDVELLIPVCTEEGILVEVTGLSPILLGWYADETAEGDSDQGLLPEEPGNPATGDTGAAMLVALMLVAVLGMAAVVITDKKRVCRK